METQQNTETARAVDDERARIRGNLLKSAETYYKAGMISLAGTVGGAAIGVATFIGSVLVTKDIPSSYLVGFGVGTAASLVPTVALAGFTGAYLAVNKEIDMT